MSDLPERLIAQSDYLVAGLRLSELDAQALRALLREAAERIEQLERDQEEADAWYNNQFED